MTRSLNGRQRALRRYHGLTNHSPAGVGSSGHRLDWSIKPIPFKVYREFEPMPPPADTGRLCCLSNGVLRWRPYPTGEHYRFPATACTSRARSSGPRPRLSPSLTCLVSDLTYSIVLDAVGGDAGSLASRTVDTP